MNLSMMVLELIQALETIPSAVVTGEFRAGVEFRLGTMLSGMVTLEVAPTLADESTSWCCTATTDFPAVAEFILEEVFGIRHTANPVSIVAVWIPTKLDMAMSLIFRQPVTNPLIKIFVVTTEARAIFYAPHARGKTGSSTRALQ